MNNIENILKHIFSLKPKDKKESLDDLIDLYKLLGTPCDNIKIIHIAGTNGKGSVTSYIESILLKSNYSVGKFTSPHIMKYNERISFNRELIDDNDIIKYFNIVHGFSNSKNIYLNFFEFTTFIMLLYFHEKQPDFIVLETGLGGRLDATNILNSFIAIITNISYDHINILGNSLDEIAYEKAGIIKNNELCLFADNKKELSDAIKSRTNSYINVIDKYNTVTYSLNKETFTTNVTVDNFKFHIPLFGSFQVNNFLLAYEVSKILNIDNQTIQYGLDSIDLKGRFEIVTESPLVILDSAHNEDSIRVLIDNLLYLFNKNEVVFITSLLDTKDIKSFFDPLLSISNCIFVTSLDNIHNGLNATKIKDKIIENNIDISNFKFEDSLKLCYEEALTLKYKAIVVCGSFYLVSKFKKFI
mgnify:FL=1